MEEDLDPVLVLQPEYGPGYTGNVVQGEIERIVAEINGVLRLITKVSIYLTGTYYTDQQRRQAEAGLFNLQHGLEKLKEELFQTLAIASDLGYPVAAIHT